MASFTEMASLVVRDQSTAEINRINAALKRLFAPARSLKSVKIDIRVNAPGVSKTIADLTRLRSSDCGLLASICRSMLKV